MYKKIGLLFAISASVTTAQAQTNDWENPGKVAQHVLAPHAHFIPYTNAAAAVRRDSARAAVMLLDGTWHFHIARNPGARPRDFYRTDFDVSQWKKIRVPENWQTAGFDSYIFTDVEYPFKPDPPKVPADFNPVGSYRRDFELPANWKNKQVWIHLGAVNSFFYLWINGHYLGFSKDSKTPTEFDITPYLKTGANNVSIQVFRFSDGSYLEGQDMWKLSGIERSIYLVARPELCVFDFFAKPLLTNQYKDGNLDLLLQLNRRPLPAEAGQRIRVKLLDKDKTILTREWQIERDSTWEMKAVLTDIRSWNAERPALYTLVITHYGRNGAELESVAHRIGFRTVEIKGGQLLLNGVPIHIKGVNRHEHDMYRARVISHEGMRHDIEVMKQYNINAVRNSHYPDTEEWYDLCDEYGIYLVDEANIECDGMSLTPLQTLSDKPEWEQAYLHRTKRMVERDKNYCSIITWSLGNESGFGDNFITTYKYIKAKDNTRPVQYEAAGSNPWTDIICPMYKSIYTLQQKYLLANDPRPIIQCEYAHMMGNGGGNLLDDWELFYQHPRLQGGFIWDFADQTFLKTDANGRQIWAYGADMGTVGATSDTSFCADGMLAADRTPHPQAFEVRKVYQNIQIKPAGTQWRITNRFDFTNLQDYTIRWKIKGDGADVATDVIPPLALAPGKDTLLAIALPDFAPTAGTHYYLHFETLSPDQAVVATEQYPLPAYIPVVKQTMDGPPLQVTEDGTIGNTLFKARFNKITGWLDSYTSGNQSLLQSPLQPNFWRAATDNDIGNSGQIRCGIWQHALQNAELKELKITPVNATRTEVKTIHYLPTVKVTYTTTYTVFVNGDINVAAEFMPADTTLPELPRMGMRMILPPNYNQVSWLGRGPFDNYQDRKYAADVDVYMMPADALFHPYPRAQESGHRTDVRWMAMQDKDKSGWMFLSDTLLSAGVLHFDMAQLDFDRRQNKHGHSILNDNGIWWDIDYLQQGVGGDNSWGAKPHPQYQLPCRPYQYSFTLRRLTPGMNAVQQAKLSFE
ncbi:glycoside hydrolase family 2 TIM barrel-domain containing protein [Chitinophaga sp. Ak27]|uniref:glycoside hydrolase family 2 TIM barrel-domain containing protein n=1 Tax=Chitinophaga sp. Ak27 TaxID=2726116 RepID=UPI00145F0A62|nr:glycoside hydrolase family 2 TIM barrel-domain containing protein [Chitinophaga sp. Ak27]NLU95959.1 beta-galactosidase [Chitinophaga sp. Ak27]